jgi:CDP-diacylglycerol--glycerol-3-phosphate 3-phosphatidyltransferase
MNNLNLPNKLTLIRIIMVPICMLFILLGPSPLQDAWSRIISAAIFILTSLTDMLDGMIARSRGLITDFGKLMDPLADKMLVLGVYMALIVRFRADTLLCLVLMAVTFITLLRELAVTSLRLVVSTKGNVVVAADWMGKVKTVSQMLTILMILLEPIVLPASAPILSYACLAFTTVMTVASGFNYFKAYWPYIDPAK